MNFKSMMKRGCIIHNAFKRMTENDLLEAMLREQMKEIFQKENYYGNQIRNGELDYQ